MQIPVPDTQSAAFAEARRACDIVNAARDRPQSMDWLERASVFDESDTAGDDARARVATWPERRRHSPPKTDLPDVLSRHAVPRQRLRLNDYHRLSEAGILGEDDRVELSMGNWWTWRRSGRDR